MPNMLWDCGIRKLCLSYVVRIDFDPHESRDYLFIDEIAQSTRKTSNNTFTSWLRTKD